jgi:acyl dehydratase
MSRTETDGLIRGVIDDASVEMMRRRIGYPNPTLRNGLVTWPWNRTASEDAIRHFAHGYGDENPLFVEPGYANSTVWGGPIAPPGFEWTMGVDRSPTPPEQLHEETRKALRGVHLFNAGHDGWFLRPIRPGDQLDRLGVIAAVEDKASEFAGRSVIVTNDNRWTDPKGQVVAVRRPWYIHAERKKVKKTDNVARDEPGSYTDEELAEIEAMYDAEYRRGADTLYFEDVEVGTELPPMVKGPLTITDLINFFMGAGWYGYGFPALRLAYENRKRLRGFYSRNEFNAWDAIMRIHWDPSQAREIGVPAAYDIGPVRYSWLVHYATNFAGDDAWVVRVRGKFRRFNYIGDTTVVSGTVVDKRVDEQFGPVIELELKGTNQRGQENITGSALIITRTRGGGPIVLPPQSAVPAAPVAGET